jgi:hypothetical protein
VCTSSGFTSTGPQELLMTAWVVGAALAVTTVSLWRNNRDEVQIALAYAAPSVIYSVVSWHVLGIGHRSGVFCLSRYLRAGLGMRARFETRCDCRSSAPFRTLAFWRVCLDPQFQHPALF